MGLLWASVVAALSAHALAFSTLVVRGSRLNLARVPLASGTTLPVTSGAATHRMQHVRPSQHKMGAGLRPQPDGEWPLLRGLRQCVKDYQLIEEGDRILVAVSGGKDSSVLAYLLNELKTRRMLPFDNWSFVAVHLDQVCVADSIYGAAAAKACSQRALRKMGMGMGTGATRP